MSRVDAEDHLVKFAGIPVAAIDLESVRPTPQDITCLLSELPEQKNLRFMCGRQAPKKPSQSVGSTYRLSLPGVTEKHGYWPPLLAAAFGSKIELPEKLRPLNAFSGIEPEEFARLLAKVRNYDLAPENCNRKVKRASSHIMMRSPIFYTEDAPLHAVLLAVGATEAAARARGEVHKYAFQLLHMTPAGAKKFVCVRELARLQWLGADWMATDNLRRTPLHVLCATAGHRFMSSVLHTSSVAVLARFLCAQAPRAIFLEDAEGLTPLNYLVGPFRAALGYIGSAHRELLMAVIGGVLACRKSDPFALATAFRESIAFAHAAQSAVELAAPACSYVSALHVSGALVGTGAWECAFMHFHLGLWRARDLFLVSGNLRIRAFILRRIAGTSCDSKALLSESVAKKHLQDANSSWTTKQREYEERVSQLDSELGRVENEKAAAEIDRMDDLQQKVHLMRVDESMALAAPSQMSSVYTLSAEALPSAQTASSQILAKSSAVCEAEAVVARVRNARLIDIDLEGMSEADRNGVTSVRVSLSAAVQRLAQDLYELDSHFLMELVQNADDNRYPGDAAEPPSLRLALHIPQEDCENASSQPPFFFSANNENGLRTEDVVAMCDINASSKRNQPGCTGHKGIGWKSTFAVSDCPFVLSGACTFKFDIAGPLGKLAYVTPTWVPPEELSQLPAVVQDAHAAGLTVIYLPLRATAASAVAEGFRQLEEHLVSLLFFRRLKRLQLEYPSGRQVVLEHFDRSSVSFKEDSPGKAEPEVVVHKYVVHQEAVVLPGGHTGKLILAFPLPSPTSGGCSLSDDLVVDEETSLLENGTKQILGDSQVTGSRFSKPRTKEQLRPQAFYVGLPVRLTGFCFAIDGPFDLTASRADLHEGSAVNRALCDAVPVVFAAALQAHPEEIGPRALPIIGDLPAEGYWRQVRRQLFVVLNSISCIPTEDGELALPGECVERPQSLAASAASQLIPPELLLLSCGKRFARSTRAAGSLRGVTVPPLGLDEWLHVLRYRGALWPYGLVGAALREGNAESFFRVIYTWIDEEVRLAECASAVLEKIWDLELFPSAAPGHTLFCLANGPIFESFCDKLSEKWQRTLCANGVLRILEPCVRTALDGYPGSSFLSEVATVKPTRQAIASICVEWHVLRFRCANLEAANADAIWASLACLMETFLAGEMLAPPDSIAYLPLKHLEASAEPHERAQWWRELGNVLWIPTLGGVDRTTPAVARASELICASYLGVPGAPEQDVRRGTWGEQTRSLHCHGSNSKELRNVKLYCSVAYDYCRRDSSLGKPMRWEAFFDTLGMKGLRPSLNGANCAVSGNLMNKLGSYLLSEDWWVEAMKEPPVLQYLCRRVHSASRGELSWLRTLPVRNDGDALPRWVSGYFLYDVFVQLGGGSLPYVRLPPATESTMGARDQARLALGKLGVQIVVSAQSLLQCLLVLSADGFCKDAEVYADFYKEIASLDVSEWGVSSEMHRVRVSLANLVYVAGRGFMRAEDCTWEDEGVMQWLTEVPSLRANYERYGPTLRHFFLGVVETPECLDSFSPSVFVQGLRKLIEQVDLAQQNREAVLSSSPISAKSLIEDLGAVVMQVYGRLARSCEGATFAEHSFVRNAFANERLLLLVGSERERPKRLIIAEAWWDVDEELRDMEKVAALAVRKHYGHLQCAEAFFLRVLGLRRCVTRNDLVRFAKLQPREPGPLSHWADGISITDVENLTAVQTTYDFCQPSNRQNTGDEEEEEQQNDNASRDSPQQFRPPPAATGTRHPPAWRSNESLQRQQEAENARKAEEDKSAQSASQARQQRQREKSTFIVDPQRANAGSSEENPRANGTANNSERSQTSERSSAAAASQQASRQQASASSQSARRQQAEESRDAGRAEAAGTSGGQTQATQEEQGTDQEYLRRIQARINRSREAQAEARAAERQERMRQNAERRRAWERYREGQTLRQQQAEEQQAEEETEASEQTNGARYRDRGSAGSEPAVQPEHDHVQEHQAGNVEEHIEVQTMELSGVGESQLDDAHRSISYEQVQHIELQILTLEREVAENQSCIATLLQEKAAADQASDQYQRLIQNFWEQNLSEEME